MTVKREYSILPQGDKDDFHHHVREGRAPVTSQYFCLFTVITVTIVLILAGVATLTVSMFHSEPLSTTFTNFWYSYESTGLDGSNSSMATTASGDSSSSSFTVEAEGGSKDEAASAQQRNSTDYPGEKHKDKDLDYYRYHHHRHHNRHEQAAGGDQYNNSSDSSSESDQGFGYNSTFGGNGTLEESEMEGGDEEDQVIVNFVELKEKFADAMRDWEKNMEKMTVQNGNWKNNLKGIRLVIVLCFYAFL